MAEKTLWINARLLAGGPPRPDGFVLTQGARIAALGQGIPQGVDAAIRDAQGRYLAPGFIDGHVHGGGGFDFMDGSEEAIRGIAAYHARHGVTALLATTLAGDREETRRVVEVAAALAPRIWETEILGVHMEGPYFSLEQRGAQDPRYIRPPDRAEAEEFLAAGSIRRWSIAPELPGALELGDFLAARGILVSAAHTNADFAGIRRAAAHGYRLMTHLYSGMTGARRLTGERIGGAVEAGLCLDDLYVETIADGYHLSGDLLGFIYKCKGREKMALTSDAMRGAGLPEGNIVRLGSRACGQPVRIEGGVARTLDGTAFAGSVASGNQLLRTLLTKTAIPLEDAVAMLTATPAALLGLSGRKGAIRRGLDADLVEFDEETRVHAVMARGRFVPLEAPT